MANIKIAEQLFVELYKFFCINPKIADLDYITSELQKKNSKIAERLEYSSTLSNHTKRDA